MSFLKDMNVKIENLSESVTALQQVKVAVTKVTDTVVSNSERIEGLEAKITFLESKLDDLENRDRRNNVIIFGLEQRHAREDWVRDCEPLVVQWARDFLKVDLPWNSIERCHRLRSHRQPNPMIVKFTNWKWKNFILGQAMKYLPGTKYYVSEDFSKSVRDKRRALVPHLRELREKGEQAKLSFDALVVNGVPYILDEEGSLVRKPRVTASAQVRHVGAPSAANSQAGPIRSPLAADSQHSPSHRLQKSWPASVLPFTSASSRPSLLGLASASGTGCAEQSIDIHVSSPAIHTFQTEACLQRSSSDSAIHAKLSGQPLSSQLAAPHQGIKISPPQALKQVLSKATAGITKKKFTFKPSSTRGRPPTGVNTRNLNYEPEAASTAVHRGRGGRPSRGSRVGTRGFPQDFMEVSDPESDYSSPSKPSTSRAQKTPFSQL
jgi:hypothetical protein